jgi:hypothetical protein
MAYELTVAVFPDYVRVTVVGEALPRAAALLRDIFRAWEDSRRELLLIDTTRYRVRPSVTTDYYAVQDALDVGYQRIRRIAVLDLEERRVDNESYETMARNRALTFRFVYSEEEALDWLAGGTDSGG